VTRRLSFNARADEYRLARPPYPERVYDLLGQRCGLGPGTRVIEIGSGTGQATRELLERGADVVAVEPGAALAAHLRADLPAARVVISDFETADLPEAAFDLAVSATAFHWVRTEVALPKLARVVRPGGWLAVWWTVFTDRGRPTEFRHRIDALYRRYLPREPLDQLPGPLGVESWSAEITAGGWFGPVEVELVRWDNVLTSTSARQLFGSFPNVNELSAPDRMAFLDAIASLVDNLGGTVLDPHVTAVYLAPRR
jgi:SAM-dependent methyltransferase